MKTAPARQIPPPVRPAVPSRRAPRSAFLPVCRADMEARGWDSLDVLLVSGDAYADHPAFGVPLLGRLLEDAGYRVGIIAQPDWRNPEAFTGMGRPRLFCGISAGCLDSMVAHYTAFRRPRSDDAYTPGGRAGARPNRACIVYANGVRQAFPGLPLVLGGIEASLRRAAHYDFWTDSIRRSIVLDAKADLVLYGMAEQAIIEVSRRLAAGEPLAAIPGAAYAAADPGGADVLPAFADIQANPRALLEATLALEAQVHHGGPVLAQAHGNRFVILTPPPPAEAGALLDRIYSLPFTRDPHPDCLAPIPALEMVRWSVTAVRGCAGGCSFCSLALHQGRRVRSRSATSIAAEVKRMAEHPLWRGTVSDVGGPTANLWGASCRADPARCARRSCLSPAICPHLELRQRDYLELLRRIGGLPGVTCVSVASGVRHDVALEDPDTAVALAREFVGGHLKLAPEHSVDRVLNLMRKTDFALFERFLHLFAVGGRQAGREQYVVPYVMSAFPGCTLDDMRQLAAWFHRRGWQPQQVQCFLPTPGTVATAMYHAGCDPDGNAIHVARGDKEREEQHAVLVPRRGRLAKSRKGSTI